MKLINSSMNFIFIMSLVVLPGAAFAAASPACLNKSSGVWDYGFAPSACSVSPQQTQDFVHAQYGPVLFKDAQAAQGGRAQYMSEMYPVLRETAKYYIHRRNPSVSPAEEDAFVLALMVLVDHESMWTHYRLGADSIVRFLRGDSLHGFGIMQIDDRSHSTAINQGKGVDLVENMIYGLDIFYTSWVASAQAACVSSASNYKDRTRSAWAAYNGGPGSICRWTNPKSPYAQHDIDFNLQYQRQAWRTFVADTKAPSKLDVKCLAEGSRPCAILKKVPAPPKAKPPVVLSVAQLNPEIHYRFLRECPKAVCDLVPSAVRGGNSLNVISEVTEGWVQVESEKSTGWIKRSELVTE